MEDIYINDELEPSKTSQRGPRSSKRRFPRAAVWFPVILSFLLLAGIIGFTVYYHVSAHHDGGNQLSSLTDLLNANRNETTEELQRLQSLVKQNHVSAHHDRGNQLSSLTDLLNAIRSETTEEQQRLQSLVKQNHVSAHHDRGNQLSSLTDLLNAIRSETTEEQQRLQSLVKQRLSAIEANLTERLQDRENQLNVKLTKLTNELERLYCFITQNITCPDGWKMFGCSCYLFSTQIKTWDESRQDCRDRGADLVIVNSFGEQEFLTKNIMDFTWIGLSDRDNEGTWKWTDGTPLTQKYWKAGQPNGNGGNFTKFGKQDCVDLETDGTKEENWNDVNCDRSKRWICEIGG